MDSSRGHWYARMAAYAAYVKNDPKLAQRAWKDFLTADPRGESLQTFSFKKIEGAGVPLPVDEVSGVSTNNTAQWCLNAIELLEMVGKHLPESDPRWAGTGN